jgi:RNA-binding protein
MSAFRTSSDKARGRSRPSSAGGRARLGRPGERPHPGGRSRPGESDARARPGAEAGPSPGPSPTSPKRKKRRTGGGSLRLTKKTGDVRSKPDKGREGAPSGPLTGKAMRYLRGLGHHLDPIVQVGKDGITDALVTATREALAAHELIKVRVGTEAPLDRKETGALLAEATGAELAQTLGRTFLLYLRHPKRPRIVIPA